jgi:hypothetical protein
MIPDHILPALDEGMSLLPFRMDSAKARVQLLAIGLQESKFKFRRQMISMLVNGEKVLRPTGPAKGYHQFEETGGCRGVVKHEAARNWTQSVCQARGVHFSPKAIWDAMERDDAFDFAMARLLLWTDVKPLPALGEADTAWAYYLRVWRPGKPHRDAWAANYNAALVALQ